MKTWDDWSDEDLSHAILIAIHGEVINHFCLSDCETYVYDCGALGESFYRVDLIDINKPADMWPIMLENGIGIVAENGKLIGATTSSQQYYEPYGDIIYSYDHENPTRAAAIVFLMMKGVKPE